MKSVFIFLVVSTSAFAQYTVPQNFVESIGTYEFKSSSLCAETYSGGRRESVKYMDMSYDFHNQRPVKDTLVIRTRQTIDGHGTAHKFYMNAYIFQDTEAPYCRSYPYCNSRVVGAEAGSTEIFDNKIRIEKVFTGKGAKTLVEEVSLSGKNIRFTVRKDGKLITKCEGVKIGTYSPGWDPESY